MGKLLTSKRDVRFELCFKYPLQRGYTFNELSMQDKKAFQNFLDRVSRMTVQQVDQSYARKPDHTDIYAGYQVYHYEVTRTFRIHVICEDGSYKVIRLDPHHEFHG